jgi:nucleolar protein 56
MKNADAMVRTYHLECEIEVLTPLQKQAMDTALSRMDIDGPSADLGSDEEMADITPRAVQKQEKQKKDKKKEKKDKRSLETEEEASDVKKRKHAEANNEVDAEKKKKKKKKSMAE